MSDLFDPGPRPSVEIKDNSARFPVHRIYCVGRNYAAHAREMGGNPDREAPFFFSKPADAVIPNHADIPYPLHTGNLHHEVELVVALGGGGTNIGREDAAALIFGYAVGNDLTRRDLQAAAKDAGRPWDAGKGFDRSAPIAAIHPKTSGILPQGRIWLSVNGQIRQDSDLSELIWSIPEIIAALSTLYELKPGDLIFTGTPAGVGPIVVGDVMEAGIEGFDSLVNRIV